jgi:hypothetical protein
MTGTVPVFKLHGSLNWTLDEGKLFAYQDMRPVFRGGGTAAIIAPVPEKSVPDWLAPIWTGAAESLRSDIWVVCGYSLPAYDIEVCNLLRDAGKDRRVSMFVLSPESDFLRTRFAEVVPSARITCLPGLPGGTVELATALESL